MHDLALRQVQLCMYIYMPIKFKPAANFASRVYTCIYETLIIVMEISTMVSHVSESDVDVLKSCVAVM